MTNNDREVEIEMKRIKLLALASVLIFIFSISTNAKIKTEIAISSQANWWSQAAGDREAGELIDNLESRVISIENFPANNQDALADWTEAHTGNGQMDILILFGQFPDTIYPPGNAKADGSIAEDFLEDGNLIANTGDYMFYVVNGAGTNGAGGLQTMMDIPGITMWDDNTAVEVTEKGKEITPTLKDFQTDRPFHLDELDDEWEAELVLAGDTGDQDAMRADPVVVRNTEYDGRLAIFYQTATQDADPRAEVISEWVKNWVPEVAGGQAVEAQDKLTTTWADLKSE